MTSVNIHWKIEVESEEGEYTKIPVTSTISEERIAGATIISGKNQPFGCVQLYLTKNIFSTDEEGKWDALDVENVDVENVKYRPSIEVGVSTVDVEAYGEVKGYIISNVSTDDDHTIIIAYHPAYRLSHTLISSVFSNLLTVESVSIIDADNPNENYATFNVGLEGYSTSYEIPNDKYRARLGMGCQDTYVSVFPEDIDDLNNLNSEYKATGSSMINLSKYTSGRGYLGTSDSAKNKYTFWYQKDFVNLIFHIIVEDISKEGGDKKYIRTIEWIEGRPDDIIRFIVKEALNMEIYPQYFSDPKTYYPNPDSSSIKDDVYSDYTEEVLEKALAKGTKSMNATDDVFGTPIGHTDDDGDYGDYTDRLRIRVNASITCGGLIDSIANLTNRKYSFSGEGFFMTDNVPNSSATKYTRGEDESVSKTTVDINTTEGLLLDFDGEEKEDFNGTSVDAEPVSHSPKIQDNMDSIVISSQSVESENYSVKIPNTSAVGSKEGTRIILPIVDMGDDFNSYRNRMTKLCAYNTLVRRFKYDTNISHHISELTSEEPTADNKITDYEEYVKFKANTDNHIEDNTVLYDDGIVAEKCKWSGEKWEIVNLTEETSITPRYSSNSFVKEIRDNFNGLVIKDVPLAYIIRSYPEYMTELLWGRAPTNDMSAHIKQQESESASNSTSGNEDTGISNKFSSRLVVGNMTQKQLTENNDTRAGYTGLIMEKNIGSELYRLSGYNKGELQAYFNSQGEIMSGNGKVKINKDGITIGVGAGEIDPSITSVKTWSPSKTYLSGEIVKWDNIAYLSLVDGNLNNEPGVSTNWQQLTYNTSSVQVWVAGTYKEGQTVIYDGMIYESLIDDNTATPGSDDTKWKQLTYDNASIGIWAQTTTYRAGEVIIYNNIMYRSKEDGNTNKNPASSTTYWEQLTYEDSSVKTWAQGTYDLGQIVLLNNVTYISTASGNTTKPGESPTWQQLTYIKTETYNSAVTYSKGQFVLVDNDTYVSLQDGNLGHTPASNPTYWSLLTYSDFYVIEWEEEPEYEEGQLVLLEGITYVSTANNNATKPGETGADWSQLTYIDSSLKQWVMGTSYKKEQMVVYKNLIYQSNEDNNTTEPTTVGSQWTQITEYDNASIGIWAPTTTYRAGEVIIYNNIMYRSKEDGNTNKNPASSTTYWEQLTYEDSSVKTWVEGSYALGQIVILADVTYISTVAGNTSKPGESSTWQQLTYIKTETYSSTVTYRKGQFVLVDNDTYVSLQDGNIDHAPASSPTYWSLLTYSDFYVIEWKTGMACDVGQLVLYGGKTYVATAETIASDKPGESDKWQQLTYVDTSLKQWVAGTSYRKDQMVIYKNLIYQSTADNNTTKPTTPSSNWTQITEYESTATWDASITYRSGQSVVYNGFIYISLTDSNVGKNPASSTTHWKQITYGDNRTTIWTINVEYPLYQLVFHQTKTYICIKANNTNIAPGTNDEYWSLLTYDDIGTSVWDTNVTYGVGRLVIYNTRTYESLEINKGKTPGLPANEAIWKEIPQDVTYWSGFIRYKEGDVVIQDSILYTSIKGTNNYNKSPKLSPLFWKHTINTTDLSGTISTDILEGEINASNNKVKGGTTTIDQDGLSTYDSNNNKVCYVGTDGNIQGITINASQIVAGNISADMIEGGTLDISNGAVKIDENGVKISKYVELAGSSDHFDQLQIDGDGLSVINDEGDTTVSLNREGLSFEKGGVTVNGDGFRAKGIRSDNNSGLSLYKTIEGEEIKVAQMTSEGLAFGSEEKDGDDVRYNPVIILGSEGLDAGILTIGRDRLTTSQGGVNISSDGIDTIRSGNGVKLNQNGLSIYSESASAPNSTLKFIKEGEPEVVMGTISSGLVEIPVPDVTTGGISDNTETYATIIDGQSDDEGDSTLILRSTSKGLKNNTLIKSPQMSNKGVPMYMEYNGTVTLGYAPNGISHIHGLGDTLMGYNSSKFPLGICNTSKKDTILRVRVRIIQPCDSHNWSFIRYYGLDVNVGGISLSHNLNNHTPTADMLTINLTSSKLEGVKLGNNVSVSLNYGATNNWLWFMFEACRPRIFVERVWIEGGGITTTQNATLPVPFDNVIFSHAYWCGSFVELSHSYVNTVRNRASKSIYFRVYRDKTYAGIAKTISANNGTVSITPSELGANSWTGMYNAQYRIEMSSKHIPANLEVKMDADYTATNSGGGHIYLRDDGNYLRGNTEIRGGDKARVSIRSSEGGNAWGATGIDFHNSKVDFNIAELDGSPVLSERFMNSIRSKLVLSAEYRAGLSRSAKTWYTPVVSSRVNIVMITQSHQTMTVHLWPTVTNMPTGGIEIFRSHDWKHGDGRMSATIVVPIGYSYMISESNSPIAYEFPLRI